MVELAATIIVMGFIGRIALTVLPIIVIVGIFIIIYRKIKG